MKPCSIGSYPAQTIFLLVVFVKMIGDYGM